MLVGRLRLKERFMLGEKVLLIANPASRHGEGAVAAVRAERLLRETVGARLAVMLTSHQGHAADIAESAAGLDAVVALGGDGLIHEVLNGLMAIPAALRPPLGVIPAGSGNDYAGALGMAATLTDIVHQLDNAPHRTSDVGCCNGEYFMETLSFGLDAAIALDTIERRERTGAAGFSLYVQSGIDQLLHNLKPRRMEAVFDGKERREDIILCAVQNGPTYGGGFRICPDALFDDGLLDVCIAHAPVGALKAGWVFLRAKSGHHRHFKEIETFRAREISLRFDEPLPVQIDGEPLFETEYKISVEPGALRVIAPNDKPFSK